MSVSFLLRQIDRVNAVVHDGRLRRNLRRFLLLLRHWRLRGPIAGGLSVIRRRDLFSVMSVMFSEVIEVKHGHAAGFAHVFRERRSQIIQNFLKSSGIFFRGCTVAEIGNAIFSLQNTKAPDVALIQNDLLEQAVR